MKTRLLRSIVGLVLVAATLIGVGSPSGAADVEPPPDDTEMAEMRNLAQDSGSVGVIVEVGAIGEEKSVIDRLVDDDHRVLRTYDRLPYVALEVGVDSLDQLLRDPDVVSISANTPEPANLASTLPVINADDVHNLGWTGVGRTVAILDTGIDADHPFFTGRIVAQACFSGASGATLCPNGMTTDTSADIEPGGNLVANCMGNQVPCEHGTHVAGIAAGALASDPLNAPANGVAPGANIIAVQVFSQVTDAPGNTPCANNTLASPCILTFPADQIAALNWVAGQTMNFNIDAVNMSLGGGNNTAACDGDNRKMAIDNLLALGVATVISSGNNGFINAVGAPSCISTAVTVGATDDFDNVTRNRGTLLDVFAPGSFVQSAGFDDNYVSKGGTSMAAPHVAGAFAVLREAYPTLTVAEVLALIQNNGVAITYPIDMMAPPTQTTTPRLDLLASLTAGSTAPALAVDDAVVAVDEGQIATNSGTVSDADGDAVTLSASIGTITDNGDGTWGWTYQTSDGPTEGQTVTVTAVDDKGATSEVTFELVVDNVNPSVMVDGGQITTILEGQTLDVAAAYSDPGWPDTHTATIDWGTPAGDSSAATIQVTAAGPPQKVGVASGAFQYGDDGVFAVTIDVVDDDGGVGSAGFAATVENVAPTADIDDSSAITINGQSVVLAEAGQPVDFSGSSTDPGSDDLTVTWDWDDGSSDTSTYLNDPAFDPDPDPSPEVNPRDISDVRTHEFSDACVYDITFSSADDDGGETVDTATVVIVGTSDRVRSPGYWKQTFRRGKDFSSAELDCYREIVNLVSSVFSEVTPLGSSADALAVLNTNRSPEQKLDRQLLTAYLNFANGSVAWDQLIDTDGDGSGDTTFADVVGGAEAARLDMSTSRAELLRWKDLLERINLNRA